MYHLKLQFCYIISGILHGKPALLPNVYIQTSTDRHVQYQECMSLVDIPKVLEIVYLYSTYMHTHVQKWFFNQNTCIPWGMGTRGYVGHCIQNGGCLCA